MYITKSKISLKQDITKSRDDCNDIHIEWPKGVDNYILCLLLECCHGVVLACSGYFRL